MKKLLSLILALACAASLTACGGDKSDDKKEEPSTKTEVKKELDGEDAARDTAENFFDAFCDFEFEKAEKYYDGEIPSDLKNAFSLELDKVMSDIPPELSPYKSEFEDLFNTMIEKSKQSFSYKITNVEGDGDEYIVSVDLTTPNVADVDFDAMLSGTMEEELMALVMEYAESGKITETMSEEEMMDILMPEMMKILKSVVNDIEFETTTESGEITVAKVNGKWLVTEMD